MAKRLAKEEGILSGISGGANVLAAMEVATPANKPHYILKFQLAKHPENKGKLIVTSIASFGERYLSTVLYKDIKEVSEQLQQTTLDEDRINLNADWGLNLGG